ncbi:hypothetical protein QZH41_000197 [Actinostola sp. cb2023]|nr:hypothetical protein QZH41_000197 [Actinostola sp. cb2023]
MTALEQDLRLRSKSVSAATERVKDGLQVKNLDTRGTIGLIQYYLTIRLRVRGFYEIIVNETKYAAELGIPGHRSSWMYFAIEALKLVAAEDIATLELTLGQRKLLLQAVQGLSKTKNEEKEDNQIKSEDETTPVTTKTLAKDGGLEEILKKIEGISLDDPLYTLGATEQPSLSAPLGRLDQNPQVFLGSTTQQSSKKGVIQYYLTIRLRVRGFYEAIVNEVRSAELTIFMENENE